MHKNRRGRRTATYLVNSFYVTIWPLRQEKKREPLSRPPWWLAAMPCRLALCSCNVLSDVSWPPQRPVAAAVLLHLHGEHPLCESPHPHRPLGTWPTLFGCLATFFISDLYLGSLQVPVDSSTSEESTLQKRQRTQYIRRRFLFHNKELLVYHIPKTSSIT